MQSQYKDLFFLQDFLSFLCELNANCSHDGVKFRIVDWLKHHAFQAFAEYSIDEIIRVGSKGRVYRGRLDFYASRGDIQIVGEIDRSTPKKNSIKKCSKYPNALKVFLLRGSRIRPAETQRRIQDIENYLVVDLKGHEVIFSDVVKI